MRNDPIVAFCFKVNISAGVLSGDAFFKSVSGIKMETEVVEYRAGGVNASTYKLVGATKWNNIILKRGFVAGNSDLLTWRSNWLKDAGPFTRATITVTALDTKFNPISNGQWVFIEGWPCKWEISDFDGSKNEVAIETLEIAHHGIRF